MSEDTPRLAIIKKEFETSIYGNDLTWKEGEVVWIGTSEDMTGLVTICKFDKPFATHIMEEWVEEFIIEWVKLR